jgi:cyclophilin family peptidyl-prolyl cis-trans isomerase
VDLIVETDGGTMRIRLDAGGCQLFLCHSRAPHLDVRYTAFGKVVEGLDVIDRIDVDSKILRVRVAEAR